MFTMIGAMTNNNCVGKDNSLPWKIPSDLQFFKSLTENNVIVMGWNTFLSLNQKPLPNRENIILVKDGFKIDDLKGFSVDGFKFFTMQEIIEYKSKVNSKSFYIIGGPKTWELFADYYDTAIITRIDAEIEGDAYVSNDTFRRLVFQFNAKPLSCFDTSNDEYEYMIHYYKKKP